MNRQNLRFPFLLSATLVLLVSLLFWPSAPARAIDQAGYTMEVLVDGTPLQEYFARSAHYVQALEGREYSIRLTNRTGERIAVALAVDGLNSIDAKTTTALAAQKWILGPWESITLDGWQTTSSTARHFFFTSEKESYGAWLGKTKNLGIVTAAVFREKRRRPVPIEQGELQRDSRSNDAGGAREQAAGGPTARADAPASEAAPPAARSKATSRQLSDELAATGIGRELGHEVRRVSFDEEESPAALLEIRYEYHDALVKLGVLPRPCPTDPEPLARREHARGFSDTDFAPDPYRSAR